MEKVYFVYVLLDSRREGIYEYPSFTFYNEPIYVGKGSRKRDTSHLEFRQLSRESNRLKANKILKIKEETGKYPTVIRIFYTHDESYALLRETQLMNEIGFIRYGTGFLTNLQKTGFGRSNPVIGISLSEFYSTRNVENKPFILEIPENKKLPVKYDMSDFHSRKIKYPKGKKNKGILNPMWGTNRKGSRSPTAKYFYVLIDPNDTQHPVDYGCLIIECKKLGIGEWSMRHSAQQFEKTGKLYRAIKGKNKGWAAVRFENPSDNSLICNNR